MLWLPGVMAIAQARVIYLLLGREKGHSISEMGAVCRIMERLSACPSAGDYGRKEND